MKRLFLFLFSIAILASCSKEGDQGPQGPQGPTGPGATVYDFDLTFSPEDTFKGFDGMMGDYYSTDAVIVYYQNDYGWTPLPYYWVGEGNIIDLNIFPEITDEGRIWINTIRADGNPGSPWADYATLSFRAVLIEVDYIVYLPNKQTPSYTELQTAFDLKE
ncbi:MAG: membrane lipoprotein lipid attachment site-containing protein [Bacteroidales bacterium]|nr:membrane lipoprotein lipid attachment site-containing protein [Bacteroidales bacterium]